MGGVHDRARRGVLAPSGYDGILATQAGHHLGRRAATNGPRLLQAIATGGLLDILAHPNQAKYSRQRILVVAVDNYAHLVPFVEDEDYFFLKTIIPSRKATRDYLQEGEADAED